MQERIQNQFLQILREELVPAFGCTEPIAIAFTAAKARQVLGGFPQRLEVRCSGNIIKNVKAVIVPATHDMRGIEASAILGALAGDPEKGLEVLNGVQPEDVEQTRALLKTGLCQVGFLEGKSNLQISVEATLDGGSALVEVAYAALTAPLVQRQIYNHLRIADEGLTGKYGAAVGRTLLDRYGSDVKVRAKAYAAAGSDARMAGCELPVVINSGSGNQGMTASLPVHIYAEHLGAGRERECRALALSNLVAICQKRQLGKLSAYCGAVSAAAGAGAGIASLPGADREVISNTIINTLGNVSGIVCDGAKASCAAKIASSVDAANLG